MLTFSKWNVIVAFAYVNTIKYSKTEYNVKSVNTIATAANA